MVEVVNMVGSGSLGVEFDLETLSEEIGQPRARYDPNKYPGMYVQFDEDSPLVTLYRTGKYIITGATSEEQLSSLRERFLEFLSSMDVIKAATDS
jgi:transcription initiation factor TFIID TATA-box-binding protein